MAVLLLLILPIFVIMMPSENIYGSIMISIEVYPNPAENPEIVKLVFHSMRNKYTSEESSDGLTFKEVRSIISKQPVTVIKHSGKIVGVIRSSIVNFSLRMRLGLEGGGEYLNFGMIYIAKSERGNGYAGEVLKQIIKKHKNIIYIVHKSTIASNKTAAKQLEFFKEYSSFRSFEPYNIYKTEQ